MRDKRFYTYLGAAVLSALSALLGNFVDGVIVSHMISADGLSAINLCKPISQFYYTCHQLFGLGGAMLVGMALGSGDRQRVSDLLRVTIALVAGFSLVMTVAGFVCPGTMVGVLCSRPELYTSTLDYARPLLIGSAAYMGMQLVSVLTAIDGAPMLVSIALVVDNVVNLGLDLILLGCFNQGIEAAGVATVIGHLVGIAIMSGRFIRGRGKLRLLPGFPRAAGGMIGEVARTGAPFAIASIALTAYMLLANRMILGMESGSEKIYIFSVMTNLLILYNFFIAGSCQTLQQLGSLQVGENDLAGLKDTTVRCFRFMMGCQSLICVVLLADADPFCRLFSCPDTQLAECGMAARIYAFAFFIFSVNYLSMVYFKLLGYGRIAAFISVTLSPAVLPFIWLSVSFLPGLLWWSNFIGYALVLAVIIIWKLRHKLP